MTHGDGTVSWDRVCEPVLSDLNGVRPSQVRSNGDVRDCGGHDTHSVVTDHGQHTQWQR